MEKVKRLENLTYKANDTGYIYMGVLEELEHSNEYYTVLKNKGENEDIYDYLEDNEEEYPLSNVIQKVVYYNPRINTSIIFEVIGDVYCYNYGFNTIDKLIDDIHTGVNSLYAVIQEGDEDTAKSEKALLGFMGTENSVVSLEYMNSENVWLEMRIYRDVLKEIKVTNILDIFQSINGKEAEGYYKR